MLGHFSRVQLFAVLWGVAHKTPLCMGFSRQECCSGLSCPPPGDLPHPRFKLASAFVSCPAGGFFTPWATWEALFTSEPSSNSKLCNCCWIIEYMCKNVLHHKEWKKKKKTQPTLMSTIVGHDFFYTRLGLSIWLCDPGFALSRTMGWSSLQVTVNRLVDLQIPRWADLLRRRFHVSLLESRYNWTSFVITQLCSRNPFPPLGTLIFSFLGKIQL